MQKDCRPTLLYVCHVDWQWIKQRPQFLAEELSSYYRIHVAYPWSNRRSSLQKRETTASIRITPYFTLPTLGGRLRFISRLNQHLQAWQLRRLVRRSRCDMIWLTLPSQLKLLPSDYAGKILYDCMDDHAAFWASEEQQRQVLAEEKALLARADFIFASAQRLLNRLEVMSGKQVCLLRNGYDGRWPSALNRPENGRVMKAAYVGTIGKWFDFQLLLNALEKLEWLEIHLFGPAAADAPRPEHERLIWHGTVEHAEIPNETADMDLFLMPFTPCEVVLSVDPVKLYEYLFLDREILTIRYPEVERFDPYVWFYRTEEEFIQQLCRLHETPQRRCTRAEVLAFLESNQWKARAANVYEVVQQHTESTETK